MMKMSDLGSLVIKGITVFKIFIWGGISSVWLEISSMLVYH